MPHHGQSGKHGQADEGTVDGQPCGCVNFTGTMIVAKGNGAHQMSGGQKDENHKIRRPTHDVVYGRQITNSG